MRNSLLLMATVAVIYIFATPASAGCATDLKSREKYSLEQVLNCVAESEKRHSDQLIKKFTEEIEALTEEMEILTCDLYDQKISTDWRILRNRIMENGLAMIKSDGPIIKLSRSIVNSAREHVNCSKIVEYIDEISLLHNVIGNYANNLKQRRDVVDLLKDKENKNYLDYRFLYGAKLHLSQIDSSTKEQKYSYKKDAKQDIKQSYKSAKEFYFGPRRNYVIQQLRCATIDLNGKTSEYIKCLNALLEHSVGAVAHLNLSEAYAVEVLNLEENKKEIGEYKRAQAILASKHNSIRHFELFSELNDNICELSIIDKTPAFSVFLKGETLTGRFNKALKKAPC